jgi:hypothetical protein
LAVQIQDLLKGEKPALFTSKIQELLVSSTLSWQLIVAPNGILLCQNTIFEEASQASDKGAWIHIPRLVLSASMELNRAFEGHHDLDWLRVGVDDPRVKQAPWYQEGRETPLIGK